jgi:hypothetical protein
MQTLKTLLADGHAHSKHRLPADNVDTDYGVTDGRRTDRQATQQQQLTAKSHLAPI